MLWLGPWIATHFYHAPELANYLGLFAALMILGVFTAFFGHVLAGYKAVARRTVINNFIGTPATMLTTILLVSAGLGLKGYIAAQCASAVLVLFIFVSLAWRLTPKPARSFSGPLAPVDRETVSVATTTLGMALLGFVMTQTETVVLGR